MGTSFPLGNYIDFGAVIRNLGYTYKNNLKADIPVEYGIGTAINIRYVQIILLSDFLLSTQSGKEIRTGLTTNWKRFNFNAGKSTSENRTSRLLSFKLEKSILSGIFSLYFDLIDHFKF